MLINKRIEDAENELKNSQKNIRLPPN